MTKKTTFDKKTPKDEAKPGKKLPKDKKPAKDKPVKTVVTLINLGLLFEHRLIPSDALKHLGGIQIHRPENIEEDEDGNTKRAQPQYRVHVRFRGECDVRDCYTTPVESHKDAVRMLRWVVTFFQAFGVAVEGEPLPPEPTPESPATPGGPPEEAATSPFEPAAATPE